MRSAETDLPGAGLPLPAAAIVPVQLGRSNVCITGVGLGLREIGRSPENTRRLLDLAARSGIRYIDTAPSYGPAIAERRLGDAMQDPSHRDFVVSTKVGQLLGPRPGVGQRLRHGVRETITGGPPALELAVRRAQRAGSAAVGVIAALRRPPGAAHPAVAQPPTPDATDLVAICDYSYDGAMRSLDESLRRLRIDRIDILYIHDPEVHRGDAMRGTYRALETLRSAGTIGAIGVAMNHARRLAWFATRGDFDVFMIAGRYSLLDQSAATDLFPITKARGITVVLAGLFNGGLLANPRPGVGFNYGRPSERMLAKALAVREICDRHQVSIGAAALQFARAHPAVASLLLGAATPAELEDSVRGLTAPIQPDLWDALREAGHIGRDLPIPNPTV